MGFFESLFYIIWRGIAIGLLISAPMGPVGILCIQRTLDKGRKTGLYTGIGAAISDLFYCLLTGFGLSFIENFLERNQNIIQLAGSALLIAFAVYLFKKNPASALKTPEEESAQVSPHKNILGGFLFTFSNPLILFLIIGLFARFNFLLPEIKFYYYIAGYAAIFVGAVLWWEFVTFTVNKLKAHFNLRSMYLINRIIGVIILLFALVGIITGATNMANAATLHWNKGRGYAPFEFATPEGIIIENQTDSVISDSFPFPNPTEDLILTCRIKNLNGNPAKKYKYITQGNKSANISNPGWGFLFFTERDTLVIKVKPNENFTAIETEPCLDMSIYFPPSNLIQSKRFTKGINPFSGDNLWEIRKKSPGLTILGGNKDMQPLLECPFDEEISSFGFFTEWGGKILISDINLTFAEMEDSNVPLFQSISELNDYFAGSRDTMEGYWSVFDRELEESQLKFGGDYKLACIKTDDGYSFLYIEGSTVNAKAWKPFDLKIQLSPTMFHDIYNVEWIDAMKESMKHEIKAQKGEGNTLLIQFPYQGSRLRLRKTQQ